MGPHPLFIEKKLTKKKKTNKEITRNYQNCKESCRAGPHLLFMEEAQQKLIFTALTRMRCRGIFMIILLIFIFLRSFKNIFLIILLIFIFFRSLKNISMIILLIFIFLKASKIYPWLFHWYSYFLGVSKIYAWLFFWYSYI